MNAFIGCTSLTSVIISTSVTSIGIQAFSNCTSLTSIVIPTSVISIGDWVFSNCSSLTDIQVESGNLSYSSENGILFNADKTVLVRYPEGKKETTYVIPSGVTRIGDGAFSYCSSLTSVTIGNGVTSIGWSAFRDCTSLTSVTIPDSVTSIGSDAFSGCTSLESVRFEGTVAEWNSVDKGSLWKHNCPFTEVVCSDGTVTV